MIYQPILNASSTDCGEVRFRIRYRKEFAEPGDPLHDESHIHSCYEIYFNLSGEVSFWANNRLYPMRSGDMIVTRPGDVHLCVYNTPSIHEHFCLWLEFDEMSPAAEYISEFFNRNHYSFGEKKAELADMLFALKWADNEDNKLKKNAALFSLLSFLGERSGECGDEVDTVMPDEMQKIVDDLNENFASIHHISELLERHYVSRATLDRWFRKYLRVSPRDFLEAKKLAYAKALLTEGKTVTDACMLSGFSDCSHFIAVFKKKFGETPLKYKSR